MTFALLYADNNENHILKNWKFIKNKKIENFNFNIFQQKKNTIILLETKIGLINAALAATLLLSNFKIDVIVNYGAVGACSNKNLKIFDLVIPKKIYFADVITPWYKNGQFPNENEYFLNSFSLSKNKKFKEGNLASSMGFEFNEKRVNLIQKRFSDISIFDMESASFAFVANKFSKKIYVIKAISDIVGKTASNNEKINENIKKASFKAFEEALFFIENFKN